MYHTLKSHSTIEWNKLFSILEKIEVKKIGIKFGNKIIDMLRFVDDMAALAETKKELEEFLESLNKVLEEYNIKI